MTTTTRNGQRGGVPYWVLILDLVAVGAFGALWWTTKAELDDLKASQSAEPDVYAIVWVIAGDKFGVAVEGEDTFASVNIVGCGHMAELEDALSEPGCPRSLAAKFGNTRALDGTLEEECERASLSWTYHPDSGLNLVIERKRG